MTTGSAATTPGRPRVLVTPRSLTAAGLDAVPELAPLRERFELVSPTPGRAPGEEELRRLLPGCVGWLAGVERIGPAVLGAAPELRVISRNGAGTDAIDLAAAERAGVRVLRAPGANAQGVAELVLAVVMSALRHLPACTDALRAGRWERRIGSELADRRVGIVGLGEVGRRTARIFRGLGADVVGHDPYAGGDVPLLGLDELLATCDIVSLSCPPRAGGQPLLGDREVALLPAGAILVNTARTSLVAEAAVLAALEDGRLGYYTVDAYDTEPPESSALLAHPRVIATPHLGGFTDASVRRATEAAVANLLAALAEER